MTDAPCADCGVETVPGKPGSRAEWYMVHPEVWKMAGMNPNPDADENFLCIGCLEIRLGRMLTHQDFTSAGVNDPTYCDGHHAFSWRTPRLASRLQGWKPDDD